MGELIDERGTGAGSKVPSDNSPTPVKVSRAEYSILPLEEQRASRCLNGRHH